MVQSATKVKFIIQLYFVSYSTSVEMKQMSLEMSFVADCTFELRVPTLGTYNDEQSVSSLQAFSH